ncbi:20661_t:CDS:1, partial [Racocetra persica]
MRRNVKRIFEKKIRELKLIGKTIHLNKFKYNHIDFNNRIYKTEFFKWLRLACKNWFAAVLCAI